MSKEYEFYEHFGNRKSRLHDEYDDAYNSSVSSCGVAQPTPADNMAFTKAKTTLIAIACTAVIAVSAFGGIAISNLIESRQEDIAVTEFFREQGINHTLEEAYWSTYDGSVERTFGYNHSILATAVEFSENPELTLFGFYNTIDTNKKGNMDALISHINFSDGKYENTDAYLLARGFVDENGNPSYEVYEEVMKERVLAEKTIQETNSSHGISR